MHDFEEIFKKDILEELIVYMKEHSDIDSRKRKLEKLLNNLIIKRILQKFTVKYDEKDFADLRFWTTFSILPVFKANLCLNILSSDLS